MIFLSACKKKKTLSHSHPHLSQNIKNNNTNNKNNKKRKRSSLIHPNPSNSIDIVFKKYSELIGSEKNLHLSYKSKYIKYNQKQTWKLFFKFDYNKWENMV